MVTKHGFPPDSAENLKINTFFDELFDASTYLLVAIGLALLRQAARRASVVVGSLLVGFGCFDFVEGIIDQHLLKLHHGNETVSPEQRI